MARDGARVTTRWLNEEDDEEEDDQEEEEDEDYPRDDGEEDFSGVCHDILFRPCSPVFAPPPPGHDRATLPRP